MNGINITNKIINRFNEEIEIVDVSQINKHNIFSEKVNDWLFGFDDNDEPKMLDDTRTINIAKLKQMAAEWGIKTDVSNYLKELEKNFNSLRKSAAYNRYTPEKAEKNNDFRIAGLYFTVNDKGKPCKAIDANICSHICTGYFLSIDSDMWRYNDTTGSWCIDKKDMYLWNMIGRHLPAELSNAVAKKRIAELVSRDLSIQKSFREMNQHLKSMVCFKDCVMDTELGMIYDHDPEYYFTNCINYDAPDIDSEEKQTAWKNSTTRKWLEDIIPDPDDRLMLACYVAYMLTMQTDLQRFLILRGEGGTGKGTLLRLIEKIIGIENYSSVSLESFAKDTSGFLPKVLYGKLANINGDISDKVLNDNTLLKQITGEDSIRTEVKFAEGFEFESYAKLLFAANTIPPNNDPTNAFYRRMMIIEINKRGEEIENLEVKLDAEKDLFLWFCVKSYHENIIDAVKSGNIHQPKVPESHNSKISVMKYQVDSDEISQFLLDETEPFEDSVIHKKMMFSAFQSWAEEANSIPGKKLGRNTFYKRLENKGYVWRHTEKGDFYFGLRFRHDS